MAAPTPSFQRNTGCSVAACGSWLICASKPFRGLGPIMCILPFSAVSYPSDFSSQGQVVLPTYNGVELSHPWQWLTYLPVMNDSREGVHSGELL